MDAKEKRGAEAAIEKAMDDAVEFMSRKGSKQEQDAFLQQVLFGMG